jgi:hypothetical protein
MCGFVSAYVKVQKYKEVFNGSKFMHIVHNLLAVENLRKSSEKTVDVKECKSVRHFLVLSNLKEFGD